jgi:hypothetical protein
VVSIEEAVTDPGSYVGDRHGNPLNLMAASHFEGNHEVPLLILTSS